MSADQVHNSDKPVEKHDAAPQQPHFDALALMKEHNTTVGADKSAGNGDGKVIGNSGDASARPGDKTNAGTDTQASGAQTAGKAGGQDGRAGKAEPDHLIMTDPFAGLQGSPETQGVKAKGHDTPKTQHGKDGADSSRPNQGDASKGQAKPDDHTDGQPIKIVGKPEHLDPSKPTVAFLDDFSKPKESAGLLPVENHGEISAKGAEANGFNVYRVQTGTAPMGEQMQAMDAKIKSGELPLGKGDAVNVSLGSGNDLPVEGGAKFFGVSATNDTLAQNKDKLLDGIKAKSEDSSNPALQSGLGDVVKSNDAIKDMQDKGIRVLQPPAMTAAANSAPTSSMPPSSTRANLMVNRTASAPTTI
jgi:hypothetical protein